MCRSDVAPQAESALAALLKDMGDALCDRAGLPRVAQERGVKVCGVLVTDDNEYPCLLPAQHDGFCDFGDLQVIP